MLANNVVELSYADLAGPLRYDQAAPPGFVVVEKAVVDLLGLGEHALRLLPLLAGLATVAVGAWLAWRLVGPAASLVVAAALAVSPGLVRFSTEVKQYATDGLLVVSLLAVAAWAAEDHERGRRFWALAALAVVAPWFSYTSLFAIAGVGAAVAWQVSLGDARDHRRRAAGAGALVAASALALFVVNVRHVRGNDFLAEYWRAGFPPEGDGPIGVLRWLPRAWVDAMADPVRADVAPLVAAVAAAGALVLLRRRHGLALAAAAGAGVVAAAGHVYPLDGRVALWLVPLVPLLVVAAASAASSALRAPPWAGTALVGVGGLALVLPGLRAVPGHLLDPLEIAQGREAVEFVADRWRDGDLLVVHGTAGPVVQFYGHAGDELPVAGESQWHPPAACAAGAAGPVPAGRRVWVVYAYTLSTRPADDAERIHRRFGGDAAAVERWAGVDASATAYPALPPPRPAAGGGECLVVVAADGTWRHPLG